MAQYLILLYEDEAAYGSADSTVYREVLEAHNAFGAAHAAALIGGNALQPTATATSIRRDGTGQPVVTDGPFAETKEALGGYYLVEVPDLDAAVELGKQVPARFGGVEVRPVQTFA